MNTLNTGHSALTKWQPSWKHHHAPKWFKKAVRRMAIKQGGWQPCLSTTGAHLPRIFDHWGSFLPAPEATTRKVATMPYQANDDEAIAFAAELGCEVECLPTGPWHPATRLFIFSEPVSNPSWTPISTGDPLPPVGQSICSADAPINVVSAKI